MAQTNPKRTNIAINAAGGAMTNIPLTILASKVKVMEDPALNGGNQQGLLGFIIDTQWPQPAVPILPGMNIPPLASPQALQTWLPNNNGQVGEAFEPIIFGGDEGRVHGGEGNYVGAQGTVILQLTTNSNLAGGVILIEWP